MWCWWAHRVAARPHSSRPSWSPPGYSPDRAPSSTAPPCATATRRRSPSSAPSASRSRRCEHDGVKVNLIDTPGYADFVGELRAGLRAADCALFVIAANEGVDDPTKSLWLECAQVGMPRAVVITKLDHARANYESALAAAQAAFGDKVLPLYLAADTPCTGLIGLLSQTHYEYADGKRTDTHAPDASYADAIEDLRGTLIEGIIEESEDETLMERYLGGEEIDQAVLIDDLEKAVARGSFFPVIPVCSGTGVGTLELLEIITSAFPVAAGTPAARGVHATGQDPRRARHATRTGRCWPRWSRRRQIRTSAESAWSGCSPAPSGPTRRFMCQAISRSFFGDGRFSARQAGHADHDEDERIGTLSFPLGKQQRPAPAVVAGDICAIGRLTQRRDRRHAVGQDRTSGAKAVDDARTAAAHRGPAACEDRRGQALGRPAAAGRRGPDAAYRAEPRDPSDRAVVHGRSARGRGARRAGPRYGVAVDTIELRVPLRETFGGNAKGHGRHVKQSGGHGQFAVCDIEVEPLPEGSGFEFVDKVVGGAVPRNFIPSVEKGVRAQMEKGVGAGYPVVDIRVTLLDGKAHSVDSSDFAFQMAGGLALREAAAATRINLLEPVDVVSVLVPDDMVGSVMSDLSDPPRPGAWHREGRRGPHAGEGRDTRGRIDPLRNRFAVAVAWRGIIHTVVRALRADARAGSRQGEDVCLRLTG